MLDTRSGEGAQLSSQSVLCFDLVFNKPAFAVGHMAHLDGVCVGVKSQGVSVFRETSSTVTQYPNVHPFNAYLGPATLGVTHHGRSQSVNGSSINKATRLRQRLSARKRGARGTCTRLLELFDAKESLCAATPHTPRAIALDDGGRGGKGGAAVGGGGACVWFAVE